MSILSIRKKIAMIMKHNPDSKVHGAYMGPTWGRQDPGGPHVGPMIIAIWECLPVTQYGITDNG